MIQSPRGAEDVLPPESGRLRAIENAFIRLGAQFGYREIRTPIFEEAALFEKGTGETTELVTKEMYLFQDRGGRSLALRPEGTPAIVRAVVQHHLLKEEPIAKVSYVGPMFRYERPQRGRGRQFHQAGVEFIGVADALADAEVIHLLVTFLGECGISNHRVLVNNLGCFPDRNKFREALADFLKSHQKHLAEADRKRLLRNPFRVLDSKEEETRAFLASRRDLPVVGEFLCEPCRVHHSRLLEMLKALNIKFEEVPTLVRGLDYYERTVFEVISPDLGAQDALGGGGRYDHIFTSIGFPEDYPAVGFALGLERLLLVSPTTGPDRELDLLIIPLGDSARAVAFSLLARLRKIIASDLVWKSSSLRSALKFADRHKIPWVAIIGDTELNEKKLILRNMNSGEQIRLPLEADAVQAHLVRSCP
jgi:histidyl-tRNA synthetase